VRQTILTALALWDVPRIAAATAESDFDLTALRSKRMSVFVCCQQADIDRLRPIFGLLFEQIVALMAREEFGDSPDHRHLVFMPLDEAWALGRVRAVADAAAFIRSSGLRIAYVLQNKQMVSSLGDEGAKNLFANTGAECLFGGVDQDTAEEVSRRGGNDTVTEVPRSRPRWMAWAAPNRQTENEAARRRALMLPQEVQRLGDDELLVLRPRLGLLKIRRVFWYKDTWFKRMGGEPPPVPRLAVPVERDMAPPVAS
jgi:type IV secretion system protein VirD4